MQEYNNTRLGKLQKKRSPTRSSIKRLQFIIHILEMENKFKNFILKSINILQSMIWMIQRRTILLQTFKDICLQTSGEKITNNNSIDRSP